MTKKGFIVTSFRLKSRQWIVDENDKIIIGEGRKAILENIGHYYPGATSYEVAGFLWWQGDSDRRDSSYVRKYEENLVRLVESLRSDFGAPDAKFAVATLGQKGDHMEGEALEITVAQLSLATKLGNVEVVDTRSSWRGAYQPGYVGHPAHHDITHYGNNGETVMEVGNALGLAMARLLNNVRRQ